MTTPAIIATLAVAILGAALSVFVVLKRLAFIGQGVSHAAFGGVGIALVLGIHAATTAGLLGQMSIVLVFSVGAALLISALSRAQRGRTDTAIGLVLSASMALGFVLFAINESRHAHDELGHVADAAHSDEHHIIEEILFGNILDTNRTKATLAVVCTLVIVSLVWALRRRLIFWAFDEPACDAYAVSSHRMTDTLLVLLAVAVVMAMQVVGVILAAAVFVLPGAAALNLSSNLRAVFAWSLIVAVLGSALGIVLGVALAWPVGPCIVLVQSAFYLFTQLARGWRTKSSPGRLRSV